MMNPQNVKQHLDVVFTFLEKLSDRTLTFQTVRTAIE